MCLRLWVTLMFHGKPQIMTDLLMITFIRNASYEVLTSPDGHSTAEWSLSGGWHITQWIFHYHKESLFCGRHHISWHECYYSKSLLPHVQGHSSLSWVPPTVPTQALGWEFSQNIETMSQLQHLGHTEKDEECLEVLIDPVYLKVL